MMIQEKLINFTIEGGIAIFNLFIILRLLSESRLYLRKTPDTKDYAGFTPKSQVQGRIEESIKNSREIGMFFLKRLIPAAFIISILAVAMVSIYARKDSKQLLSPKTTTLNHQSENTK